MSMFHRHPEAREIVERIERALVSIRPLLRVDDVGVELVQYEATTGVAVLRYRGDCPDCEMSAATLRQGIEAQLRLQVPDIREIRAVRPDEDRQ